jgi:hypothetical protein
MYDDIGTKFKIELQKQFTEMANKKEAKPQEPEKLTKSQQIAVNVIAGLFIFGITIPLLMALAITSWGLLVMAFKFFFG